jgi:radical SAM protein (TIGR01212 family)
LPIPQQIDKGAQYLKGRHRAERFLAYFQPGSNTHAPVKQLRTMCQEALAQPGVVGLIIGTRPDCLADDVLDLLGELSQRTWLAVELGLQTIHNRTLDWMNRGHSYEVFRDAIARGRDRGLRLGAHVILGLPGESRDEMLATARELARLQIDSVKLHNLHAVRGTPLAEMVASGEVGLCKLPEYVGWVVDFLERLPIGCVIDRLSGDAPREFLVGPNWCLDKQAVRSAVLAEFRRRDSWQGKSLGASDAPASRR